LLHPANDLPWRALPAPRGPEFPAHQRNMAHDWCHAVETGEATLCGVRDGAWAIEMLTAVYRAHLSGARVAFPLKDRSDPLA
jgi:hypothetical protein